jgi:hypothetical protein
MTGARGHVRSAGETSGDEHAGRGAARKTTEAGLPSAAGWVPRPLSRLASPDAGTGSGRVRVAQVLQLQRTYGNTAVRRQLQRTRGTALAAAASAVAEADLAERTPAAGAGAPLKVARSVPGIHVASGQGASHVPAGQRPLAGGGGSAPRVQRWKDDGHIQTTVDAANMVFPARAPFFTTIGMTQAEFIKRVGDASINMDKIVPHLGDRFAPGFGETKFFSFTATLIGSVLGDMMPGNQRKGKTRRGIKGEGPDHGEAGYYDVPRSAAIPGNVARTEKYVDAAVQAYKDHDFDLMIDRLGDACHVAADRGSHDEGGQGQGHDTRMPDPEKGEKGTNFKATSPYMENWADNDIMDLNPDGYRWGLICTIGALRDFFEKQGDVSQGIDDL